MRTALWPDSLPDEIDAVLRLPSCEGIVVVGERDNGGLRGFAEIGLRKYADGCDTSPVAYLEGIWIDEDSRRSGVAERVVPPGCRLRGSRAEYLLQA